MFRMKSMGPEEWTLNLTGIKPSKKVQYFNTEL